MHAVLGHPVLEQVAAAGVGDREEGGVAVQQPERERLGEQRGDRARAAQLGHVVVAVDVVHERDARAAQPQRREERDPVDHLEHDVGVAADPVAQARPRRAREDREPRAHTVHGQLRRELLARRRVRVGARDDRDAVAPRHPARHLAVQVRARPAALRMGPVAVREHEDVHAGGDGSGG